MVFATTWACKEKNIAAAVYHWPPLVRYIMMGLLLCEALIDELKL